MESGTEHHGACLCGAVRVAAKVKSNSIEACHCTMCRKWGGGPFLSVECDSHVQFEGADSITTFDSSDWADRGFCRECGTHLFYRLKQEAHYAIPVGLFENGNEWVLSEQIYIDEKPAFYSFAEATRDFTGVEIRARYSGE